MSVSLPTNHTPHAIKVYNDQTARDLIVNILPTEPVLRLVEGHTGMGDYINFSGDVDRMAIPVVFQPKYTGLSHAVSGSIIVSMVVAQWLAPRPDVIQQLGITAIYSPDTGPQGVVRNERGEIVGTTRLVKYL